jgi:glycerate dehydrogenase
MPPPRVLVTTTLPGTRWRELLAAANCQVEVRTNPAIPDEDELVRLIGTRCDAAIGQLTEPWTARVLTALHAAGGRALATYAVGFNNIDVDAATRLGIPVGNTPGVLTEATAELALALTFAAARHLIPADRFTRDGRFTAWRPDLFLGTLLHQRTLGLVGAGRIGTSHARALVAGHHMHLIYHGRSRNPRLEAELAALSDHFTRHRQPPVSCRFAPDLDPLLAAADVVALHTPLTPDTRHLLDARRLALMKPDAILVNTSRGPVVDETALVAHLRSHPQFRAALDVYEDEPALAPGLTDLPNTVLLPHLGSATHWSREQMAAIAARNVTACLQQLPAWDGDDILPFLGDHPPAAAPSIVNAVPLGLRPA